MTTGYYLQDHPNRNTQQYGWERAKIGQPGVHLSGVIGVHTSEAITDFEGVDNNAENNAAFIGRRADYGSYHTTGDADSRLALVHPRYAAWADTTNNAHAMSVSGCLQAARWLEMTPQRAAAVVRNMAIAAAEMVLVAVREGYLATPTPARRITAQEAVSGSRAGFYGHGETNPGTRYDPGQHFDWNLFLATYEAAIGGNINLEEDDMFTDRDRERLDYLWETVSPGREGYKTAGELAASVETIKAATESLVPGESGKRHAGNAIAMLAAIQGQNAGLLAALQQIAAGGGQLDLEAVKEASRKGALEALSSGVELQGKIIAKEG